MTNFLGATLQRIFTKHHDNNNSNNKKKELKRYGSSSVGDDDDNDDNVCPDTKKKCYRKFAVGYSTERHFRIANDEEPAFYGAYGNVRKQLDYTYHEHYRKGTSSGFRFLTTVRHLPGLFLHASRLTLSALFYCQNVSSSKIASLRII